MKNTAISFGAICLLATGPSSSYAKQGVSDQVGTSPEQEKANGKEDYQKFIVCAAYEIVQAKVPGKSEAEAASAIKRSETHMFAAFLADPDKSEDESETYLIEIASKIVNDTENGDEQTKREIANLREACEELYPLAVQMTKEAEELTNAT